MNSSTHVTFKNSNRFLATACLLIWTVLHGAAVVPVYSQNRATYSRHLSEMPRDENNLVQMHLMAESGTTYRDDHGFQFRFYSLVAPSTLTRSAYKYKDRDEYWSPSDYDLEIIAPERVHTEDLVIVPIPEEDQTFTVGMIDSLKVKRKVHGVYYGKQLLFKFYQDEVKDNPWDVKDVALAFRGSSSWGELAFNTLDFGLGVYNQGDPRYAGLTRVLFYGSSYDDYFANFSKAVVGAHGFGGDDSLISFSLGGVLAGHDGNDYLVGMYGPHHVHGGSGHDVISTGESHDMIAGGSGNDTIRSGGGDDWIHGGSGADILYSGKGHDIIYDGSGNDLIFADGSYNTIMSGSGIDNIYATGSDLIYRTTEDRQHDIVREMFILDYISQAQVDWSADNAYFRRVLSLDPLGN